MKINTGYIVGSFLILLGLINFSTMNGCYKHSEKATFTASQVKTMINTSYMAGYYQGAETATNIALGLISGNKASILIDQEFKKDSIVYYNRWKNIVEE